MHRFFVSVLFMLLAFFSTAVAAQLMSADEFFRGYLSFSQTTCSADAAKAAEAKKGESQDIHLAYALKSGHKTICECVPARVRHLRATLPRTELDAKLSQNQLAAKYMPTIVNPCAAEQFKLTYSDADGCADRFVGMKPNPAKFCACMFNHVSKMNDVDIARTGTLVSSYLTLAADAKRRGAAVPMQPAAVKQFTETDAVCSAER